MKKTISIVIAIIGLLMFSACRVSAETVTLAWDQVPTASGYNIYVGSTSRTYTTKIDVGNVTTYKYTVSPGMTAYFAATAYTTGTESDYSKEVSYSVLPLLTNVQLPVGIGAKPAGAVITWDSFSGAAGYKIKYGTAAGSYTTTIDAKAVTQYLLSGLTNSTNYYLIVTAYSSTGADIAKSDEFKFTTLAAPVLKN